LVLEGAEGLVAAVEDDDEEDSVDAEGVGSR
jgi:hypothetical protein